MLLGRITEILEGVTPTAFLEAARPPAGTTYVGSRGVPGSCPVAQVIRPLLAAHLGEAVVDCTVGMDFINLQLVSPGSSGVVRTSVPLAHFPLLAYIRQQADDPAIHDFTYRTKPVTYAELAVIIAQFEALTAAAEVLSRDA